MSYVFEGKISNQAPAYKLSGAVLCSCCRKVIARPKTTSLQFKTPKNEVHNNYQNFNTYSYLDTDYFIYESKSGTATLYCSKKCRNKHNHRFAKKSVYIARVQEVYDSEMGFNLGAFKSKITAYRYYNQYLKDCELDKDRHFLTIMETYLE